MAFLLSGGSGLASDERETLSRFFRDPLDHLLVLRQSLHVAVGEIPLSFHVGHGHPWERFSPGELRTRVPRDCHVDGTVLNADRSELFDVQHGSLATGASQGHLGSASFGAAVLHRATLAVGEHRNDHAVARGVRLLGVLHGFVSLRLYIG